MHSEHLLCARHSAGILHPRRRPEFPHPADEEIEVGPRLCLQVLSWAGAGMLGLGAQALRNPRARARLKLDLGSLVSFSTPPSLSL